MHDEVVKADPRARRRALALAAGTLILGLPLVFAAREYFASFGAQLAAAPSPERLAELVGLAKLLLWSVVLLPWLAVFLVVRFGLRVLRAAQYPLPGAVLVRDTRVFRGGRAKAIGLALILAGCVMALVSTLAAVTAVKLTRMLDDSAATFAASESRQLAAPAQVQPR